MSWCNGLKGKILFNEPLSRHTTLRIGPEARIWIEPYNLENLKILLTMARLNKIRYLVVGLGSKLLIRNKNMPLVIHLGSAYFKKISIKENEVEVGAGVGLGQLIRILARNGLGGMEFLSGIPASLGGALVMNAGVSWPEVKAIGELVKTVEVLDKNGSPDVLKTKELRFGYRCSNLSKFIITAARLRMQKKPRTDVYKGIKLFLDYRHRTQDLNNPSAGCVFKNPVNGSAGKLIDLCGLKGMRMGGAAISDRHANFIVNYDRACAEDVLGLMRLMQIQVRRKFGLDLKPEIQVV